MSFRLYNSASGGTPLWTENWGGSDSVKVSDGLFNVMLGSLTTIPESVFQLYSSLWLGITIGTDDEMAPRVLMGSTPYSYVAQVASNALYLDGQNADEITPPGTVVAFAGTSAPPGWLLCDGSEVSRTMYPVLFDVIGNAHGIGNGSTTFNLPDYRGRFLRGVDDGSGRDPDTALRSAMASGGNTGGSVGSIQGDMFASHSHTLNPHESTNPGPYITSNSGTGSLWGNRIPMGDPNVYGMLAIANTGGNETRPLNAYVNWIIKY